MKILFISHQASKTGAPIALLSFLKWLTKFQNHNIRIIIIKGGELDAEFKSLGKTTILEKKHTGKYEMMMLGFNDLYPKTRQFINGIKTRVKLYYKPDVVYLNSIASMKLLPYINNLKKAKVLCHVHEMEYSFTSIYSKSEFLTLNKYVNKYIVPSEITGKDLADNFGISYESIDVINEPIEIVEPSESHTTILKCSNSEEKQFIVMGAGLISWRKAPEIFIMIAKEVVRLCNQKVKFIWLGELYPPYYKGLIHDISKMGLSETIEFVGPVKNTTDYFHVADVFLLTSREDPYPLVCLEAASQGLPVICFDKSGGMQEFVKDDAGFVVPYLDIKAAADKIIELINDPKLKRKMGEKGRQRVYEVSDISNTGPKIIKVIESLQR